jgi:exodeoxyribonuclease V alpha subunit
VTVTRAATAPEDAELERFDVRRAVSAPGVLRAFNDAGVLSAADVHVACRLGTLGGDPADAVLLAAALAVRAPRLGHVCTDLATVRGTVTTDLDEPVDLQALPWPEPVAWAARLAASPLVAADDDRHPARPLRLDGTRLYLDRFWRDERQVAADLRALAEESAAGVDLRVLAGGLHRLFAGTAADLQRTAAAAAVLRRFAVVAGGPGTGKTTMVAGILALLDEQAAARGTPPPRVALAAPTGKAAARLEEAVRRAATELDIADARRDRLLALDASTVHRLLGWRPGARGRFRHDRSNRLPHDVVVVDETSMVALSLMARLLEALRTGARLILVGDPQQLASVEAGAVLGDIVGPAAVGLRIRPASRDLLTRATGHPVAATDPPAGATVGDGIVVLRRVHRFGGGIADLAQAVQCGDADATVERLRAGGADVRWIEVDVADDAGLAALAPVRRAVVEAGRRVTEAARAGDAAGALEGLAALRVLCAHRRGAYGVATWMARVEGWLAAAIDGYGAGGRWYVGRPLLVTENDHGLRLYNGDVGVIVAAEDGRVTAAFGRGGSLLTLSPTRLAAVDTVHAMTVHKSQGSQFQAVAVVLPDPGSPILTRELLYTAVTRARTELTLVGTELSVRAAVARPIARASGLRDRLWGGHG